MEFVRVARSGQVPEGIVRRFYAGEHEFAVARLNGKAYATSNYCTHLDCLLSSGKLRDDGIGCSCHGSAFDLETGEPISPPATEPIQTFPVQERDGDAPTDNTQRTRYQEDEYLPCLLQRYVVFAEQVRRGRRT